ncbi:MAG: hypothetical protein K8S55_11685 [Phycisphaerae bacterium]|nr:hypothetical protein [Phycisphaerae bacterium]
MNESAGTTPSRSRGYRKFLLYIALLVSCGFAGWQIYVYYSPGDDGDGKIPPRSATRLPDSGKANPPPIRDFSKFLRDPAAAMEGLHPTQAQPPAEPPEGAKLSYALVRKALEKGMVDLLWSYTVSAELPAMVDYYRRELLRAGFRDLGQPTATQTRQTLLFRKKQTVAYISLRNGKKNARIVRIVVTVTRPAQPGDVVKTKKMDKKLRGTE